MVCYLSLIRNTFAIDNTYFWKVFWAVWHIDKTIYDFPCFLGITFIFIEYIVVIKTQKTYLVSKLCYINGQVQTVIVRYVMIYNDYVSNSMYYVPSLSYVYFHFYSSPLMTIYTPRCLLTCTIVQCSNKVFVLWHELTNMF